MEHEQQFDQQTLTEHLAELRSCLLISLGAVAAGFAVAYGFVRKLADWFVHPLIKVLPQGKTLIFTSYQEGFFLSKISSGLRRCFCESCHFYADMAVYFAGTVPT